LRNILKTENIQFIIVEVYKLKGFFVDI